MQLTGSHYSGAAPDLGRYETAASPPANTAPTVSAGADKSIALPTTSTSLAGTVTDDGKPTPPGTTTKSWTQVSGPAGVTFGTPTATTTTATFPSTGTYTLRLTASDSALSAHDDVAVTVTEPSAGSTVDVRISAGSDDAEQSATGGVSLTSSDLELVNDGTNQTVGLRFPGVNLPRGATITRAWVQFQADEANTEATTLTIRGQAADNAVTFTSTSGSISARPVTTTAAMWSPAPWPTIDVAAADQRTSDLAAVIAEVAARPGWSPGNAIALILTGTGHRTAEASEGVPSAAPLLHVEYGTVTPPANRAPVAGDDAATTPAGTPVAIAVLANDTDPDGNLVASTTTTTCAGCSLPAHGTLAGTNGAYTYTPSAGYTGADGFAYRVCDAGALCDTAVVSVTVTASGPTRRTLEVRIASGTDDAEETSGTTSVSLTSSDLELVTDGTKVQTVGLVFRGITIPRGAVIENAYVQFTVDQASTAATSVVVQGQAADTTETFTTTRGNLSTRPRTTASVPWVPASWPTANAAGVDQRTPSLATIVQEITTRTGWQSGNALAILVTGSGTRTAAAYNKSATTAPLLHIEYTA